MGKFIPRNNIILQDLAVKGGLVQCKVNVSDNIKRYFTTDTFFIEYDEDMSEVPESILVCPFLSSLLAFAWITNSVIWVNDIDAAFYESLYRLRESYQEIYYRFQLKGRVVPSVFTRNKIHNNAGKSKSLILFSGGVDCHASLIRNWDKNPVLCNIQGWFKSVDGKDSVADADCRDICNFSKEFGLSFSYVRSNFATVIKSSVFDAKLMKKLGDTFWHGFLHSMAFITISMPLAYKKGIDEIIIASSLTTGQNFLCASNSTTDTEFRFAERGRILHDGFELHRQNKIHIITEFQRKLDRPYFMRVCSFHDKNCCYCEKCFRTVLGIVAENSDPEDFGFHIKDSLKVHWQKVMNENIVFMSFASEKVLHWPHIIKMMKANYQYMGTEKREFVDWFLSYDFDCHRKKSLRKYYMNNFIPILKRKVINLLGI